MVVHIYAIECSETGFVYIGCTAAKLSKRFRDHRWLLENRKQKSLKMIEDWYRYGDATFTIRSVETLPVDISLADKRAAEKKWIDKYHADGKLYNVNLESFSGTPESIRKSIEAARKANTGRVHTAEERLKRSVNNKGKHTGHGAKISATKKALGQQPSRECIEKSIRNRQLRAAEKRASRTGSV